MNKFIRKSSQTLKPKEFIKGGNREQLIGLIRRSSSILSNIDPPSAEDVFNFFLSCIKKTIRSNKEDNIINFYLSQMTEFIQMIKTSTHENSNEILKIISSKINYLFYPANRVLFRFGEKGDKFFIVLKGKVNVLVPKDMTMMLTEDEYNDYVMKLERNNETQLLMYCKQANDSIFPESKSKRKTSKLSIKQNQNPTTILSKLEILKQLENQTTINYIETLKPSINMEALVERKEVRIWIYFHILSFTTGSSFGENALTNFDMKRTATIITEEDSHFGIVNKENFDKSLREAKEIQKNAKINFLLSTHVLSEFGSKYFKIHYLNFFVHTKLVIYDKIVTEGQAPTNIFFIKEGEFEVSFRKSICEINDLIKYLGGDNQDEIDEERSKMSESTRFSKYVSEKKLYRISIIKSSEVIGLNDLIFNNKYGFTVECISSKGEVYKIENNIFSLISDKEIQIKPIIDKLISKKRIYLLDRLKKIKQAKIVYYNSNIEKDVVKINSNSLGSRNNPLSISIKTPKTKSELRKIKNFIKAPYIEEETRKSKDDYCVENKNINNNYKSINLDLFKSNEIFTEKLYNINSKMNLLSVNIDRSKEKNIIEKKNSLHNFNTLSIFPQNYDNNNFLSTKAKNEKESVSEIHNETNQNKTVESENSINNSLKIRNKRKYVSKLHNKINFSELRKLKSTFNFENLNKSSNKILNSTRGNLGFANEFKMITEYVKRSKDKFKEHLYQKITSSYCSEQSLINQKKSINLVDCLALDNFNRIYSKMSLPLIKINKSQNKMQLSEKRMNIKRVTGLNLSKNNYMLRKKIIPKTNSKQLSIVNLESTFPVKQ